MYKVKYVEDGVEKESREFAARAEAFAFQAGILARRKRMDDGTWNPDTKGVYNLDDPAAK